MNKLLIIRLLLFCLLCTACNRNVVTTPIQQVTIRADWEKVLQDKLPLLGHRNWIVVTDMAYPLQAKEGILTLYAEASCTDVLAVIKKMIDNAPHIYAHVYQDKELSFLNEKLCPGIDSFRININKIISDHITVVEHERLIARLDSISNQFQVILIKTNQTLPYTSVFFELDCKYWNDIKQKELDKLSE
ncbi:MAG: hypothetical protein RR382_02120 [Tannerellaceae bacterium]